MKRIISFLCKVSLLTISLILIIFIGEILCRTYDKFVRGIPFTQSTKLLYDKQLGWKGKVVFGDPNTKKYKIFVIGDSFTNGCGVEEKYMYYNVIKKTLDSEMFVYGGLGYGTLQEYLVLDKYFDAIKPDLVILQVCANDFINNMWELESKSFINNNLMPRPYLINGRIEYRSPRFMGNCGLLLSSNSRLFYDLLALTYRFCFILAKEGILHSVERDVEEKGMSFGNFNKAVLVTDELIVKIKSRTGKIPIVAFAVDATQPYLKQFRLILEKNNIEFIENVPNIIEQERTKKSYLKLKDSTHWNKKGQQICGEILTGELSKRGYGRRNR